MDLLSDPIQTAADLLAFLEKADLPAIRKRDMRSAVNRICAMINCTPGALRLDVAELRVKISGVRPVAHGVAPNTFANTRSLFASAMELADLLDRRPRNITAKHPAWAGLTAAIARDKRMASGLAAFMNWCVKMGIEPGMVDDMRLQSFLHWLETKTLYPRPRELVRRIPALWEEARAEVTGWPNTKLTRLCFKHLSLNLRWNELPDCLREDAEAYLKARAAFDLFDVNLEAPTRRLAPSTLALQREHIRLAASVLARGGHTVCGPLSVLVSPSAVKLVLRHYHEKAGAKPNAFAVGIGRTLVDIAHYHTRMPEGEFKELKRIVRQLPSVPFDLTKKNKTLLAELESEPIRARLLNLPNLLMREVELELVRGGGLRFVKAQVAAAVEILLAAPLRPQNLIKLHWTGNFREPSGPKGKLVVYISKEATKTKRRDLVFELPPELAETVRWYRREILPRLGDSNGALFISGGGRSKTQETLSQQITRTIVEKVGVHMTPHQFRHAAAAFYLEARPEDFQTVSDLLGHSFAKTTLVYAGSSTRRASRAYGDFVIKQREAAALIHRPRRMRK